MTQGSIVMGRDIKTDPGLLARLRAAAVGGLSEEHRDQQRVSFIMSALADDSEVTRAQVEKVVARS